MLPGWGTNISSRQHFETARLEDPWETEQLMDMTTRSALVFRQFTAAALALVLCHETARAQALEQQPATPPRDQSEAALRSDDGQDRFRIGVIGGVGFPRLLGIEALFKIERHVALGIEYSAFPEFAISGVDVAVWALAGDVRVFPFGSAFFVGLRAGHQHVGASTTLEVSDQTIPLAGGLDTVFLNPRLGFLWTWDSGITFGLDAGLQVPISTQTSGALALADTVALPARGAEVVSEVRRAARVFGESTLPTIDLLRLGLLL